MSPLRVVIIEDEPLAMSRLELALDVIKDAEVVGSAQDGARGLELIRSLKPDVAFLDIRMPGLDGLELAQALAGEHTPAIVFVTAFANFAVAAFELAAIDYLLKPVEFERVAEAMERARRRLRQSTAEQRAAELQGLLSALREEVAREADPAGVMRSIWVSDGRRRHRIPLEAVEWFEAERDYVRIHTADRNHLVRGTLQGMIEKLDPAVFIRIHRSAVLNLKAVEGLQRNLAGSTSVRLRSGGEAPVGRAYLSPLKARLGLDRRAALQDAV